MVSSMGGAFALGRFGADRASAFVGVVVDKRVVPLTTLLGDLPEANTGSLLPLLHDWPRSLQAISSALGLPNAASDVSMSIDSLRLLAPLPDARQIVCTGANYRQHVIDLVAAQGSGAESEGLAPEERRAAAAKRVDERATHGIPYAFPKLVSSLCGPVDDIVVPHDATQLDWELELGVVIGREAWRVPRERAMDCVAGYLIVNDVTRRELVYRADMRSLGSDWLRSKSGPGFMPHGPLFVPAAFVPEPHRLQITLELNGQVMQNESTSDMLFSIERQIEYVSSYARLLPGDILATGSPAGNGMHHGRFLRPGDVMRGSITGLGTQINRCIAEEA